jgi:tetratricopeptide (TPR) repeat protein
MKTVIKWVVALAALGGGWWLFNIPVDSEKDPYRALAYAAGGFALIAVAAGFCVVPVGRWFLNIIDVLFLPSGGGYTPPALYKLPEWMISQGRYADALAEYEKIQKHHPRDGAAYEGRLYVLHTCMGNTAAAEALYTKALRRVPPAQQPELVQYMESLRAGVAVAPQHSLEE